MQNGRLMCWPRLASNSWFQHDDTYSCMVTRYGPLIQFLKNMGVAVEVALDSVRMLPSAVESLLVKSV